MTEILSIFLAGLRILEMNCAVGNSRNHLPNTGVGRTLLRAKARAEKGQTVWWPPSFEDLKAKQDLSGATTMATRITILRMLRVPQLW